MNADARTRRTVSSVLRRSPYGPVLLNRTVQQILPGITLALLGDGMAVVAVSWFALQLTGSAPELWVAAAAAAYTLPAAVGALLWGGGYGIGIRPP